MIEAILWDNDGLLVDSESLFFEMTRTFFAEAGLQVEAEYWGVEYLGNAKHSYQIAAELGLAPELIPSLLDRRNEAFVQRLRHSVPLMPKVRETIEALAGTVRLAIVTGSPRDKVLLMHGNNGLLDHFEVIVTDDEISNPKPHPEPYLKAMEMLGVKPERCLAVEDSQRGLDSAVAAGLRCIAVPNALTKVQRFDRAHAVEADVSGVLKHVNATKRLAR
ncbi:MAG TPA: HAD family phosphatase [Chlorobaculum sp.]|uniref:Hydrolase, haloacid dehalogenase-like family n=1 Tax=Chlorobaculum tepidum (strain ATCC 49652 / DSM 12025 / NBRC 103806 / TLS) TaxID=194439 RepID=Q8KBT6_CHLTE|nr:HAD family phosphatase [Chlorobaculum tepidum]AAM72921.1 hydrolase, haloacid dehalogenase-like family [Chlorobaculum tepidum TLS]HBU22549.1 HAD family phosphatase [Chlorobaculum sp.]